MCSFHFSANLLVIYNVICRSKVSCEKKAHTDLMPKDYFMIFYCLKKKNTVYIFIHVFAGHSINRGSCTRESINTTTTFHPAHRNQNQISSLHFFIICLCLTLVLLLEKGASPEISITMYGAVNYSAGLEVSVRSSF